MSWHEVYRHLHDSITSGHLTVGSRLPSQSLLAVSFATTEHQVRKALARLKQGGLVVIWQGRGAEVAGAPLTSVLTASPQLRRDAERLAQGISTETVSIRMRRAPPEVARVLQLQHTKTVIFRERLVRLGRVPAQVVRHYIVCDRWPSLLASINETQSIRRSLLQHGVTDYHRDDAYLRGRLPTGHETTLLDIPRSQPVLETEYRSVLPDGSPFLATYATSRADMINFRIVT